MRRSQAKKYIQNFGRYQSYTRRNFKKARVALGTRMRNSSRDPEPAKIQFYDL